MYRRRIDASSTFTIVGAVFVAVGSIFLVFLAVILMIGGIEDDAFVVVPIFLCTGLIMLAVGIAVLTHQHREQKRIQGLIDGNCYVMASITSASKDYSLHVNHLPTFVVEASYEDPVTGVVHMFRSKNLIFDPTDLMVSKYVMVYLEKDGKYDNYYVDIDSILKSIEFH